MRRDAIGTASLQTSTRGSATWRRGPEPVAGLVLPRVLVRLGAEIPLAEVVLQLAQALRRRQIHKGVQELPELGPRRTHPTGQVPVDGRHSHHMFCIFSNQRSYIVTKTTSNSTRRKIWRYTRRPAILRTHLPTLSAPRSGSDLRMWWKCCAWSLGGVFQQRRKSSA